MSNKMSSAMEQLFLFARNSGSEAAGKLMTSGVAKVTDNPRPDVIGVIRKVEELDATRAQNLYDFIARAKRNHKENRVVGSLGQLLPRDANKAVIMSEACDMYMWFADHTEEQQDAIVEVMNHDPIAQMIQWLLGMGVQGIAVVIGFLSEILTSDESAAAVQSWADSLEGFHTRAQSNWIVKGPGGVPYIGWFLKMLNPFAWVRGRIRIGAEHPDAASHQARSPLQTYRDWS